MSSPRAQEATPPFPARASARPLLARSTPGVVRTPGPGRRVLRRARRGGGARAARRQRAGEAEVHGRGSRATGDPSFYNVETPAGRAGERAKAPDPIRRNACFPVGSTVVRIGCSGRDPDSGALRRQVVGGFRAANHAELDRQYRETRETPATCEGSATIAHEPSETRSDLPLAGCRLHIPSCFTPPISPRSTPLSLHRRIPRTAGSSSTSGASTR